MVLIGEDMTGEERERLIFSTYIRYQKAMIERYIRRQLRKGREITRNEAVLEWSGKRAARFKKRWDRRMGLCLECCPYTDICPTLHYLRKILG